MGRFQTLRTTSLELENHQYPREQRSSTQNSPRQNQDTFFLGDWIRLSFLPGITNLSGCGNPEYKVLEPNIQRLVRRTNSVNFLCEFSNQIHSDQHQGRHTASDEAHTASRHSQGTYLGPLFRDLKNIAGARRSSTHKICETADKKTDHFPGIIDCKPAMWNSLEMCG